MWEKKKVSQDESKIPTKLEKSSAVSSTDLGKMKTERAVNHKCRLLGQYLTSEII